MRAILLILIAAICGLAQQGTLYTNAGATGTTQWRLAKLTGAPSTVVVTATTDTYGAIGIVISGAGTAGTAVVASSGKVLCEFDAATTAGDYVQISSATAGKCADAGATRPTNGQIIGRVLSTNVIGGNYEVDLSVFGAIGSVRSFGATFDGGGSALTGGTTTARYLVMPAPCTIIGWSIAVDAGTATFKLWRIATGGTAIPTNSNSINTSGVAISSGTLVRSATVSDFTSTAIAKNDVIGVNLSAVATATIATFSVQCQ